MLMQNKYIGMCELGFIFLLLFPWFTLFAWVLWFLLDSTMCHTVYNIIFILRSLRCVYERWMTHIYVSAEDIRSNAIIYVHIRIRVVDLNAVIVHRPSALRKRIHSKMTIGLFTYWFLCFVSLL